MSTELIALTGLIDEMNFANDGIGKEATPFLSPADVTEWVDANFAGADINAAEAWAATLTQDQRDTMTDGDAEDIVALVKQGGAPAALVDKILNKWFEEK